MTAFVEAARQIVRSIVWAPGPALYPAYGSFGGRDLHWRHHGLGMLQAEFSDTLRIHIWHPKLVSEGMAWPRCVHDHRFDLTSTVVLGEIIDVPCYVREVPEPFSVSISSRDATWVNIYEIEHAKNQDRMVEAKGCSTATSAKKLTRAYVEETGAEHHFEGEEYHLERRTFHTTRVKELAITVVHRSNFDSRLARVLCALDKDVTAVSGIVRDESTAHAALMSHVLSETAGAIARMGF